MCKSDRVFVRARACIVFHGLFRLLLVSLSTDKNKRSVFFCGSIVIIFNQITLISFLLLLFSFSRSLRCTALRCFDEQLVAIAVLFFGVYFRCCFFFSFNNYKYISMYCEFRVRLHTFGNFKFVENAQPTDKKPKKKIHTVESYMSSNK